MYRPINTGYLSASLYMYRPINMGHRSESMYVHRPINIGYRSASMYVYRLLNIIHGVQVNINGCVHTHQHFTPKWRSLALYCKGVEPNTTQLGSSLTVCSKEGWSSGLAQCYLGVNLNSLLQEGMELTQYYLGINPNSLLQQGWSQHNTTWE